MVLYTCGQRMRGPAVMHPCAKAAKALDEAGHEFEIKVVEGYRLAPWTWLRRGSDRAEVKELSGTGEVPILVLDDGEVISGSSTITRWARETRSSAAAGSGVG